MNNNSDIKSLRVMAEYGSSGIWVMEAVGPFRHGMIEHKDLGISEELSADFKNWIKDYDKRLNGTLDLAEFDLVGKKLAERLKLELPNIKVFYAYESRKLEDEEIEVAEKSAKK